MTTYIIKRNNRRYNNLKFETYEKARSYIRKKLRKDSTLGVSNPGAFVSDMGLVYSNPSHSRYGYKIEKVS